MDSHQTIPATSGLEAVLPGADGSAMSIRDLLNEGPVLLCIYKSSCAASKVMLPILERIQQRHGDDGLRTLGVSQDSPNITRSFARRYGITYPLLVEGDEFPVSSGFDIRSTPTVYVLRRDGTMAYTTMGFLRDQVADIEAAVTSELDVAADVIVRTDEEDVPRFVPG